MWGVRFGYKKRKYLEAALGEEVWDESSVLEYGEGDCGN